MRNLASDSNFSEGGRSAMQGIHRQPHTRLDAQYLVALSHDLRAPITNISQALQLLEAQDAGRERPEYQRIWRNLQQINRMVENQMDYAALEDRRSAYAFSEIDIIPWLQETCEDMRQEAQWYGVDLILYCACGSARMRCDPVKLERCLLNLFTNALHHTPKDGLITISAEITGRDFYLRVSDTGAGMDDETVRRLLSALGRRRRMHKLSLHREALGLSVVKAFCHGMRGRLSLESTLGEGTSVSMRFQLLK